MVSGTFELAIGQLEFEDSGLACTVELTKGQFESEDTWLAWRADEVSQSASMRFKPVGYAAAAAVRKGAELGGLGVRICASGASARTAICLPRNLGCGATKDARDHGTTQRVGG